ncbi:hypothetical protein GCM10027342_48460 [Photobacterium alginatilyticum]
MSFATETPGCLASEEAKETNLFVLLGSFKFTCPKEACAHSKEVCFIIIQPINYIE